VCNDYGNYVDYDDYLAAFSQTRIPVKWPDAIPNLQPRDDIWPTDRAPVIRRLEDGTNEFSEIRWGFPPAQPKRPTSHQFSVRGETLPGRSMSRAGVVFLRVHRDEEPEVEVEIHQGRRALVLLSRLWRPMPQGGEAFTLLTTDPSEDVAPIHDRQMVILDRSNWSAWLQETGNEADLLRALPAGSLEVEQVR
jgi:putative SOS response-associated peptidase YedK